MNRSKTLNKFKGNLLKGDLSSRIRGGNNNDNTRTCEGTTDCTGLLCALDADNSSDGDWYPDCQVASSSAPFSV